MCNALSFSCPLIFTTKLQSVHAFTMNELVFDAVLFSFLFWYYGLLLLVLLLLLHMSFFFVHLYLQHWKFHVYFVLRIHFSRRMIVCINKITQFKSRSYQNCIVIRLVRYKFFFFSIQISAIAAATVSSLPSIRVIRREHIVL